MEGDAMVNGIMLDASMTVEIVVRILQAVNAKMIWPRQKLMQLLDSNFKKVLDNSM